MKRQQKIFLFSFLSVLLLGSFLLISFVLAQVDPFGLQPIGESTGLGGQDIRLTIAKIIRVILGLLGIIAIGIMLYGGFVYMTAGGNEEKVNTSKKILINGVIGLVIILSAFSIVQFIINKLGEATGFGEDSSQLCQDPIYKANNPKECFPGWDCANDPVLCCLEDMKAGGQFVAQSITPVTVDTKMNNVTARAIFNLPVNTQFTADKVFKVFQKGVDISNEFDYKFLVDKDGNNYGVEASYKPDKGLCMDGTTACLKNDDYKITIDENLTSQSGKKVFTGTEECPFPLEADFSIKHDKQWVLGFNGKDSSVTMKNPVQDGSISVESWFYPTDEKGGGIVSVGSSIYYIRMTEVRGLHFRLSGIPQQNPDKSFNWCDVYAPAKSVELNKWHHVVATFDKDTIEGIIYLDGKKVGQLPVDKKFPGCETVSGGVIDIGGIKTSGKLDPKYYFKGHMASACVYNSVLSEDSVKAHFEAGVGSCGRVGESNLQGGWYLDDWMQKEVLDYTGKKNNGTILGGAEWVLATAKSNFIHKDTVSPQVSPITLNGQTELEQAISGNLYTISSSIVDNSGAGYGRLEIKRSGVDGLETIVTNYFNGPAVVQGSDATLEKPFVYNYPWVPPKTADKQSLYTITLTVWDIDNNQTTVSAVILVVTDKCFNGELDEGETDVDVGGPCGGDEGDDCTEDWQCAGGNKCVNEKCTAWPKIIEVDPMHGATGNWVTIYGKNFGEEEGKVKFAIDKNVDGNVDEAEWADAFEVKIVNDPDCGDTWKDSQIIIEIPSDDILAQSTRSAIKVSINNNDEIADATNDNYGPNLELFVKDDEKLPGLCSVLTVPNNPIELGKPSGEPGVKIRVVGNSLGAQEDERILYFGKFDVPFSSWTVTNIFSEVPNINTFGKVGVHVKVGVKSSNGLKFEILKPDDADMNPIIAKIDPGTTTAGSYITITGSGFDGAGKIFISKSSTDAQACVANPLVAENCVLLDLLNFPQQCGNTWTSGQIIAQIPLGTANDNYYLALRNGKGFYTPGVGIDGSVNKNPLSIESGDPKPGICKIVPSSGVAPRLNDPIKIIGSNFGNLNDTTVYFWKNNASSTDLTTWISTAGAVLPIDSIKSVTNNKIETLIPYIDSGTSEDGSSMPSGPSPIKVGVGINISNGFDYTVSDCSKSTQAEKDLMNISFHCCEATGPDQGKWKPNYYACSGETRDAGYVWRFSTGEINSRPRVLEQCDVKNWGKENFDGIYPSPTPSTLWPTGNVACKNSTIAVKFNVDIDHATVNNETVKVYRCGNGNAPVCDPIDQMPPEDLVFSWSGKVLEIRTIPPATEFDSNTWYQVELSSKIMSVSKGEDNLGQLGSKKQHYNLQTTSKCVVDKNNICVGFVGAETAYFFDFKTADFNCQMKSAIINPKTYTTTYLGRLFSPDGIPPNPLYYIVSGISDKECIILSADAYAWKWTADKDYIDIDIAPYVYNPASTSRVSPFALAETSGVKVQASAVIEGGTDLLSIAGHPSGLIVTNTEQAVVLDDFVDEDFVGADSYKISIQYELNDITTSSMSWGGEFWESFRFLYTQVHTVNLGIREKYYPDGHRERFLFSDLWEEDIRLSHTYDSKNLDKWKKGSYVIEKTKSGDFNIYDINSDDPYEAITGLNLFSGGNAYENEIVLGAVKMDDKLSNVLDGKILLFKIEKGENSSIEVTATNTTTISISPPSVIDYEPNCTEACVNSSFWVRFDRPMFTPTYSDDKMELRKCLNGESCSSVGEIISTSKSDTSDEFVFRSDLNSGLLETSTWYQVEVVGGENGVKAIGNKKENIVGKPMKENFVWKFRTKSDPSPCVVDTVKVLPDPFTAHVIGEQTKYSVIPHSQPDQCSSVGQELNPWSYGWDWKTGDEEKSADQKVATVSNFKFGSQYNSNCNLGCVLKGSDYSTSTKNLYLCGNGILDPGEDCDIGIATEVDSVGIGCTLDCLRPGNSLSGSEEVGVCGNGVPEYSVGEECDPGGDKKDWKYCTQNCLNIGSSKEFSGVNKEAPMCGSEEVSKDKGEECELTFSLKDVVEGDENQASIGCSQNCLHEGTKLAQSWCDLNPDETDKCKKAVSWCGNNVLESGEECEIINNNLSILISDDPVITKKSIDITNPNNYCTSKCLLQNICELGSVPLKTVDNENGLRCIYGSEGCNEDCTLTGSSISYKEASLCGDAKVGVGESGFCEEGSPDLGKVTGNPVQRVYAVGEGEVNPDTLKQYTTIEATVKNYFSMDAEGEMVINDLPGNAQTTGVGDYYIACGYEEYATPKGSDTNDVIYNQCPYNVNNESPRTYGVADNSCCYGRPYRVDSYPKDGAGFVNLPVEPVCPNTLLEFDFNKEIDKNSIKDNFVIAVGHEEEDYDCTKDGMKEVTDMIESTMAIAQADVDVGFFNKIWNFIKRFLAGVFGTEANATNFELNKINVWCAGGINATPEVLNHFDAKGNLITSTIKLYLKNILPINSYVAVYLTGGNQGITDVKGVGIRNNPSENRDMLRDSIVFFTGPEVCKIDNVEIDPDNYLFNQPYTTHNFDALIKTVSDQKITAIAGVYNWKLEWQPQDNEIVHIPEKNNEGYTANSITTQFGVGNLQGSIIAVANVEVTEDVDPDSSDVGRVFTGLTSVEVNFCENPWPARIEDTNEWLAFEDNTYNFKFSYCADSGLSGETTDDLPFLGDALEFTGKPIEMSGFCSYDNQTCSDNKPCLDYYDIPNISKHYSFSSDKDGLCWIDTFSVPFSKVDENGESKFLECDSNNDCPTGNVSCKIGFAKIDNSCQPSDVGEIYTVLSEDSLRRYVFLNDKNDDVVGVQIFRNSRDTVMMHNQPVYAYTAKSINDWYDDRFDNLSEMQPIQLAGYQGLTDGRNYYINALNETNKDDESLSGEIYSNVYLFSVNQGAQQGTLKAFENILNSLEFNINITDHGKCLIEALGPINKLPNDILVNSISSIDCQTDFDCRGFDGVPSTGTNGLCSNAKTKLFRDWTRLPKIDSLQKKMKITPNPALPSGTFLPGYTVSRWSSWGELGFGTQDEINSWVGCNVNENVDSQSCWDAVSSTYHCPTFSSVYEYKYDENLKEYMLHGPLEYFDEGSELVDYFIDIDHFSSEPWCHAEYVYSPFGEKCGDGILQGNEKCEPIGKKEISDWGVISIKEEDGCDVGYKNEKFSNLCTVDADCGFVGESLGKTYYTGGANVCAYFPGPAAPVKILRDIGWEKSAKYDGRLYYFGCSEKEDCQEDSLYIDRIYNGWNGTIGFDGTSVVSDVDGSLNEWLALNENKINCAPLSDFYGEDFSLEHSNCGFDGDIDYGSCKQKFGNGYTAYSTCNNSCTWEYSSCKPTYTCGNGVVEANEACDDGALNGTYGHCAGENSISVDGHKIGACQGLHGQSCGNGKRDFVDKDGDGVYDTGQDAYLELCDFSDGKGFCQYEDKVCNLDEDCTQKIPSFIYYNCLDVSFNPFNFHQGYCSHDNTKGCWYTLDCFDYSEVTISNKCLISQNGGYSFKKEKTCSWDCQNYGPYCGDGFKQVGQDVDNPYEECDDGNGKEQDGCSNKCLKEKMECLEAGPFFTISDSKKFTYIYLNQGFSQSKLDQLEKQGHAIGLESPLIAKCKEGDLATGKSICLAYGLTCDSLEVYPAGGNADSFVELNFNSNLYTNSCEVDLKTILNEQPYRLVCSGVYEGLQPGQVPPEELGEKVCGNGIVETYKDDNTGKNVVELCDLGVENGKSCIPKYSDSCTYCSYDCSKILTVDSPAYCGNNSIDFMDEYLSVDSPKFESCEETKDGIVKLIGLVPPGNLNPFYLPLIEEANCTDKGNYECLDNCQYLQNNCVNCAINSTDPKVLTVTPVVKLLNVITGSKNKIGWPIGLTGSHLVFFYGDVGKAFGDFWFDSFSSNDSNKFSNQSIKINSDTTCNNNIQSGNHYAIQINLDSQYNKISPPPKEKLFDFPVNNEPVEVVNEYAISPPVPDGTFRVVVKWTGANKDKDVEFSGALFKKFGESLFYETVATSLGLGLCDNTNYISNCKKAGGVAYFHPRSNLDEKLFVQSITITSDTSQNAKKPSYGFVVRQASENYLGTVIPAMPPFAKSDIDITVEVYQYRANQDEKSIYVPDHTYKIKDVNTANINQSALYWHVFDLVPDVNDQNKYKVVDVQKFKTGEKQVKSTLADTILKLAEATEGTEDFGIKNYGDDMVVITKFTLDPDELVEKKALDGGGYEIYKRINIVDSVSDAGPFSLTDFKNCGGEETLDYCSESFSTGEDNFISYPAQLSSIEAKLEEKVFSFMKLSDSRFYLYEIEYNDNSLCQGAPNCESIPITEDIKHRIDVYIGVKGNGNNYSINDIGLSLDYGGKNGGGEDDGKISATTKFWSAFQINKKDGDYFINYIDEFLN